MTLHSRRVLAMALASTITTSLTACGGGGGNTKPTTPPPSTPVTPPVTSPVTPPVTPPVTTSYNPLRSELDPENVPAAWAENQNGTALLQGQGVKVGILDSGVDPTNAALAGRITSFQDFVTPGNTTAMDGYGHGTVIAEIIGGTANASGSGGGQFYGGVAPQSDLYVARVGDDTGTIQPNLESVALASLVNQGVRLFNLSFGEASTVTSGADGSPSDANSVITEEHGLYAPTVAAGGLLVWAAGNTGAAQPSIQGGMPYLEPDLQKGWLTVVNVTLDSTGKVTGLDTSTATPSNACGVAAAWCLAAPGDVFFSPVAGTTFTTGHADGTSNATAIVTGVAALVWQQFPYFSGNNVQATLLGTATSLGDPALYGYGMVNAAKAVNGPGAFDWGVFEVTMPSTATGIFSNAISGTGSLQLDGEGALTLTGQNTYTGGTVVNGGRLQVMGSVGNLTVNGNGGVEGGASGTGVINGNMINSGTFDNTKGNLAIKGNYTANGTSTTMVQLGTPLMVGGSATINGGALALSATSSYVVKTVEPVLTTGTGLTGTFSTLDLGSVFATGTLSYTANAVNATVTRSSVAAVASEGLPAAAFSTQQTAQHIEAALLQADQWAVNDPTAHAPFLQSASAFLSGANMAVASASIESLAGQIHASSQALSFQQEGIVNRTLADRLSDPGASSSSGGWFQGTGVDGDIGSAGLQAASTAAAVR
jgi:autotransporter-associated beta strand protein